MLGSNDTDESKENFINANLIHRQVIASQCPLSSQSSGHENTIRDFKRMIIEKKISTLVSLAPHLSKEERRILEHEGVNHVQKLFRSSRGTNSRYCKLFPLQFLQPNQIRDISKNYSRLSKNMMVHNSEEENLYGISNFEINNVPTTRLPYLNMSYTVSAYYLKDATPRHPAEILFENEFSNMEVSKNVKWDYRSQKVRHIWYYNWKDFTTPPTTDFPALHKILDELVAIAQKELSNMVLVTCFSGRGRSGTLAALLVSKLEKISTVNELVDIIVNMRENRDGLVETPEQFEFIVKMLGLNKTSKKSSMAIMSFPSFLIDLIISLCLFFVTMIAVDVGVRPMRRELKFDKYNR